MSEAPDKLGRTGASKGGRPVGKKSARSLRQSKLKAFSDLFGPVVAKALKKAEDILDEPLNSQTVSTNTQLSAAKLVIDKAIDLTNEVYGKEKDQESDPDEDEPPKDDVQPKAIFSQKVVPIKGDE